MSWFKKIVFFFFLVEIYSPAPVNAGDSENVVWPAESLAQSLDDQLHLERNGTSYGEVSRSSLQTLLNVQKKLQLVSGVKISLFINSSKFPNAYASEKGDKSAMIFTQGFLIQLEIWTGI